MHVNYLILFEFYSEKIFVLSLNTITYSFIQQEDDRVLDPMCGKGTLLLEACSEEKVIFLLKSAN